MTVHQNTSRRLASEEYGLGDAIVRAKPHMDGDASRILSMDQFRGYTILGMVLVNFIGYFDKIHSFFKHNDNYFSYADSIMPAFHLAVGFSFRLTMLRRLASPDASVRSVWYGYLKRSFSLVFIGVLLFGIGGSFTRWQQFSEMPRVSGVPLDETRMAVEDRSFGETFLAQWRYWLACTLKSRMWNTLVIIGVTQMVILPFVASSFHVRVLAMAGFALLHAFLTYWFNWGFVVGEPSNWMVRLWGTGDLLSWDGGFLGSLSWAVVMLSGTVVYDIVASRTPREATRDLMMLGAILMAVAWSLSCVSRLYDLDKGALALDVKRSDAASPFFPNSLDLSRSTTSSFFAEPPFVSPPGTAEKPVRLRNYWMMIKQIPTLTFLLCASGFAILVYGGFVWLCDEKGLYLKVLNTFGTNALAAYILHSFLGDQISKLVPTNSPIWYVTLGFVVFFFSTWVVVRYLEKQRILIRL